MSLDPNPADIAQVGAVQSEAQSLGIETRAVSVGDFDAMERAFAAFAAAGGGGLIVTGSASSKSSDQIIALAATYKLPAISTFRYEVERDGLVSARIVSDWVASIGMDPTFFGTHFLRRTKATLIYRRTGNLRAVQLLLGHTKIESTVRYLGIEVDDALAIAEQVDVRTSQAERTQLCPLLWAAGGSRIQVS
jgi:hypothetical protein